MTEATQTVNYGASATIHITPEAGYKIASITDNGASKTIANPYVISNVTAAHNVVVTFASGRISLRHLVPGRGLHLLGIRLLHLHREPQHGSGERQTHLHDLNRPGDRPHR